MLQWRSHRPRYRGAAGVSELLTRGALELYHAETWLRRCSFAQFDKLSTHTSLGLKTITMLVQYQTTGRLFLTWGAQPKGPNRARRLEPFLGRGAASVPEFLTRGTQYLTWYYMTSKAFVRTSRPSFYALVLKQYVLVKLLDQWITSSSSLEDLNWTGTLLVNPTTATPTVGWLRVAIEVHRFFSEVPSLSEVKTCPS